MKKKVNISENWKLAIKILPLLKKPTNDEELEYLESKMLSLVDIVGDNPDHPLCPLLEVISNHIIEYENANFLELNSFIKPNELVLYIMKQRGMVQNDLAKIMGSQGNVSKFLTGKRNLTVDQIASLSKLFNISTDALILSKYQIKP